MFWVRTVRRDRGVNGPCVTEDDRRFEALFNENFGDVLAYAIRRCPSREDAEDVVAETFAVAWRRLEDLPAGDEARLWLFGTARLIRSNRIRGHGRRQRLLDRLRHRVRHADAPGVDRDVIAHQRLRQAMSALSEADREILGLHAWEGLTSEQIATTLEISVAAAWKRLQRARDRLTVHWEGTDEDNPIATRPATAGKGIR